MFGAYSAVVCVNTLHLPFAAAVLIAALFTALVGSVVERFIIQRLYGKVAETLLGTFALSYIFQQLVRTIFGPEDQLMALPIDTTLHFGSIVVPVYNVVLLVVSVIVLAGTLLLLIKTKFGMQLRANVQNRTMVQCLGVNSARIDNLTFSYGCALAGLAGALIAPVKSVTPDMGVTYVVDSFMFTAEKAKNLTDNEGVRFQEALQRYGLQAEDFSKARAEFLEKPIAAYLELHIEQAPVLEQAHKSVACVYGVTGCYRQYLTFTGQKSHSGSPIAMRHDAFLAAAQASLAFREIGIRHEGYCTVGKVAVEPDVVTIFPGRCIISLDQRSIEGATLDIMAFKIRDIEFQK